MKKQFYKISNTFYSQDELSYRDNEQVNNLLKAADIKLSLLNEQTIGTILDMLYEGGTLKKIFSIILKRETKGLKGLYNLFFGSKKTIEEQIDTMTNSQIAEIGVHFFCFKSSWWTALMRSANNSNSPLTNMMLAMNSSLTKKDFTPSHQAVTPSAN